MVRHVLKAAVLAACLGLRAWGADGLKLLYYDGFDKGKEQGVVGQAGRRVRLGCAVH